MFRGIVANGKRTQQYYTVASKTESILMEAYRSDAERKKTKSMVKENEKNVVADGKEV